MPLLTSPKRLLRVHHVAKLCGVSPRTVRSWAESGLLSGHKRGPKLWFFPEEDVQTFLTRYHALSESSSGVEYNAELTAINLKNGREDVRSLLCGWHFLTGGLWKASRPLALLIGGAILGLSGVANSSTQLDMLSFFAICKSICGMVSANSVRPIVNFSIERSSSARAGIENAYDCLWANHLSTLPFDPGNLNIMSRATSSPVVSLERELSLSLAGQFASTELPRKISGTFDGIPLRGYFISADTPVDTRRLLPG